jgi:hypothetical protein
MFPVQKTHAGVRNLLTDCTMILLIGVLHGCSGAGIYKICAEVIVKISRGIKYLTVNKILPCCTGRGLTRESFPGGLLLTGPILSIRDQML